LIIIKISGRTLSQSVLLRLPSTSTVHSLLLVLNTSQKLKSMGGALDEHVSDQIAGIEEALARVDELFGNLDSVDYNQVVKNMSSLDRAKYDLTNLYAINSLFFMYVRSFGQDPKDVSIKDELDRIRKQMVRASEIANKPKELRSRIDKDAARRMVKSGLWQPTKGKLTVGARDGDDENWDEPMETDTSKNSRKRKHEDGDEDEESASSTEESPEINQTQQPISEKQTTNKEPESDSSSSSETDSSSSEEEEDD